MITAERVWEVFILIIIHTYIIIAGIDFAVTGTLGIEDNDDKVQYILIKVYLLEITFYLWERKFRIENICKVSFQIVPIFNTSNDAF